MAEYSSGEFDITGGGAAPTEPLPGDPAFGARAKQRRADIAKPAPGDEPTPEELAGAAPAASAEPDLAPKDTDWLSADPKSGTAGPGTQGPLDESYLRQFDVAVPTIEALIGDPTPPDPADPEGDIIARISQSLLADPNPVPQPRSFTQGEHIALGIMGALDGEVFQSVVLPMLEAERQAPRQAALDAAAAQQRRLTALQSLATLMETRKQNRAERVRGGNQQLLQALQMRQQALAGNAQRRALLAAAQMKAANKAAAQDKIGDRVVGTYTLASIALNNAIKMKKIMDNNPGVGGFIAGSDLAARVGLRSNAANDLASLGGTVSEAILMINQRRGLSKESLNKIGDSLPDIRMSPGQMKSSVANVIREYAQFMSGMEGRFPGLKSIKAGMLNTLAKSGDDTDAIAKIVTDPEAWIQQNGIGQTQVVPGSENGDVDMNLFLDDSEVK